MEQYLDWGLFTYFKSKSKQLTPVSWCFVKCDKVINPMKREVMVKKEISYKKALLFNTDESKNSTNKHWKLGPCSELRMMLQFCGLNLLCSFGNLVPKKATTQGITNLFIPLCTCCQTSIYELYIVGSRGASQLGGIF